MVEGDVEIQVSKINVVGREGQLSRDCEVMKSGSNEDQNSVRTVTCRPREKLLKIGEVEINEAEDEDGVSFQICQIFPR